MKIVLKTPLPRFANELCDVLKLFWPVEAFAVEPTAKLTAEDTAKAQFTTSPVTADMEPLRHEFAEEDGLWRCTFILREYVAERTMPVPLAPGEHARCDFELEFGRDVNTDNSAAQRLMDDAPADEPDGEPTALAGESDEDAADESADETTDETNDAAHAYALLRKRMLKRLCKLTLYDLCKSLSGKRPPWGSLTGIRPTRLLYERLAQGMSLAEGAKALSEQFDVLPDKAELLRRIVAVQQTLPAPSLNEVDVYVSIPFCRTRCAYCSFPGEALGKGKQVEPYLHALYHEMDATAKLMRERGLTLRALYIGGGTPTALEENAFAALMAHTAKCFPNPYEFTVEAGRPDTITEGKLRAMLAHRVTRISVNPQTMNDETLKAIGRDHTAAQTEEAFRMARALGFKDINMDVIAGLPGETPADFARTMARIEALSPDSLTVHTLAIKRSSRLHLEGTTLPESDDVAEMVRMGEETAAKLGMEPYYLYRQKYMAGQQQNVGYARAGAACLYNVDIMEETNAILACGAGAISKRVFADRELRIERAPNVSNVAVYVERVSEMEQRKEALFR